MTSYIKKPLRTSTTRKKTQAVELIVPEMKTNLVYLDTKPKFGTIFSELSPRNHNVQLILFDLVVCDSS